MQYDPDELQNLVETGVQKENGEYLIKKTFIKHDPAITALSPFEYIYDVYSEGTLSISLFLAYSLSPAPRDGLSVQERRGAQPSLLCAAPHQVDLVDHLRQEERGWLWSPP
jgi:hypothetical protein